jgi:glucose/arabinose dehydrogenase
MEKDTGPMVSRIRSVKVIVPVAAAIVLAAILILVLAPIFFMPSATNDQEQLMISDNEDDNIIRPTFNVETIASSLQVPWAIAFASDGRIFFTERNGSLRVIENETLVSEPVGRLEVANEGEAGLLGLALDPDFENNHYVYVYYTYSENSNLYNRISRFVEEANKISEEQVLLDKIPGASIHDGGRIKFGPDGKLYATTGDAGSSSSSQDLNSLAGKILRLNSDGTIPEDNPFEGSPVYSYGHRNPQGLDWDPETGKPVATEHGPTGEQLLFAHDEINVIEPGGNYGWPIVLGKSDNPDYVDPILDTGDVIWAPSGASFYSADEFPEWQNRFFVSTLREESMKVLNLNLTTAVEANNYDRAVVASIDSLFEGTYGRLRDVQQGPDGHLYILTSNQDGRGSPTSEDDRILRLVRDE